MTWEHYVRDMGRKTIEVCFETASGCIGSYKVRGCKNALRSLEDAIENENLKHVGFEFKGELGYTEWVDVK